MSHPRVRRALTQLLRIAALLACSSVAQAGDLGLKLQPGLAVPLSEPGARGLRLSNAASLQALLGLGRYADLDLGVGFTGLPISSSQPSPLSGMALTYGAGLRLKRPHDQRSFQGASPWVEAEALYVHAGRLSGPGFAASAGVALPLGLARKLWLGPFVRYLEMVRSDGADGESRASRTLSAGLTFEIVLRH